MRVWLKRLIFIFGIILLCLMVAVVYVYFKTHSPQSGTVYLRGLKGEVVITRDKYGVPHIVAKSSDLDAFYALGYVHAQDRLWQMEFQRHVVQGTLSELFGSATIDKDKYLRTWGFYRAAQTSWQGLSPQAKAIAQSYADGVNAYLSQKHYPLQMMILNDTPKPWTAIDAIAWEKMLAWDLQDAWELKLKNYLVEQKLGKSQISVLFPPSPKNSTTILSDEDLKQSGIYSANEILSSLDFSATHNKGSNNWVVSGKLTASGHPMLANDPHLGLQAPALWYLAEIKGPTLHVTGATLPGVPVVVIGHNDHIAWGVTNINPDTQDLYILNKNSNIHILKEIIHVRGKPDINYEIKISNVGPVISDVTDAGNIGHWVALKWTALMPGDTTAQAMMEINYAKNWEEFTAALKNFVVPSQNFVYADTAGNIGYYVPGNIPIRHWDSSLPVPDDSAHQWDGFIPFEKLPHVFNPPEGYIVSANNRVASEHYPYYLTFRWRDPDFRAKRIEELLHENGQLDIPKFEKIRLDTVSLLWKSISPLLLKAKPLDQNSQQALDVLKNWDGDSKLDSQQKTIFAYWYRELETITPDFIAKLSKYPEALFIQGQLETNGKYCQNCNIFLSNTLKNAMAKLTQDLGSNPDNWQWGKIHHAVFSELGLGSIKIVGDIWNRSISTPGGLFTVNVGTYDLNSFTQTDGASYRQIIDLNDFAHSEFIQTLGQSDNIFSRHYDDQMNMWRDGKYIAMENKSDDSENKVLRLLP
jgi:penicillin amidase